MDTWSAGAICTLVFSGFVFAGLCALAYLVWKRREMQALKIKSPTLLTIFLIANIATVVLLTLVQLNLELYYSFGVAKRAGLITAAQLSGYLLVCMSEPLLLLSYGARFLRVRRIFDAQKIYFENDVRPSEMIKQYSEPRLAIIVVGFVSLFTLVYMVVGSTVWATEENGYGILPTFSMGVAAENQKIFISLSILCLASMLEGLILAFTLEIISGIKKEFAMQQELSIFSAIWLTTTNLALFFAVHSSFFNVEPLTYSRIIFWILLIRSLAVSIVTACVPLYETITNSDEMFFPIPPNRECIESVDMVLHIPVAVDFFYNYLQSRHEQLRDKQAIHLIALYIDLRLYDKACTDGEPTDVKYDIASEIYEQYLSEEAQRASMLGQNLDLDKSYFPVKLDTTVATLFHHKYSRIDQNLNEYLFIEVYAFVLDKLREYFAFFKSSQAFVQLEDEITKQERLYEVLVEAKLIEIQ